MGDEYVCIVRTRSQCLRILTRRPRANAQSPPTELTGDPQNSIPYEGNPRILKVDGVGEMFSRELRITIEEQIVIAGNDDHVTKGKRTQPGIEVVDLFNEPHRSRRNESECHQGEESACDGIRACLQCRPGARFSSSFLYLAVVNE